MNISPEIIGPYYIGRPLGDGTMASVFRGKHSVTGHQVAIKILSLPNDKYKDRFIKEAALLQSISHPNILRVYEVGETPSCLYYSMDLKDRILTDYLHPAPFTKTEVARELELHEKITILSGVINGIDHLHSLRIIHRDICPNNIILDEQLLPYLIDLGLSRDKDDDLNLDSSHGNPKLYGAPEQDASLRNAEEPADIYSFGVMSYQLISGNLPKGINFASIKNLVSELPDEIAFYLDRCLDYEPTNRPTSHYLKDLFSKYSEGRTLISSTSSSLETVVLPKSYNSIIGEGYVNYKPYDVDEVAFLLKKCHNSYQFIGIACMAIHIPEFQRMLTNLKSVKFILCNPDNTECIQQVSNILNKDCSIIGTDITSCINIIRKLMLTNNRIELLLNDYPPAWRVVVSDNISVLLRNYKGNRFSFESPMLVLDDGPFAEGLARYFNNTWELIKRDKAER